MLFKRRYRALITFSAVGALLLLPDAAFAHLERQASFRAHSGGRSAD
jgi:hypothetical protein